MPLPHLLLPTFLAACVPPPQESDVQEHAVRLPPPSPEEIAQLPPDGGPEFNRLVFESSPYLLQHARNPVDWYPWGDEAFEVARREDKPIFLSIGYSTCHWCHVMEHESFEDDEVAKLMNEAFVCIKVDREERPDLDHVYMSVTQAMAGNGGWPMTVIMTPDRKPFFAGTYFPKHGRFGRAGMMELVPQIAKAWREKREQVVASGEQVSEWMANIGKSDPGGDMEADVLALGYEQLASGFDPVEGGFGSKPKFPIPHNMLFLLQHHQRTGDAQARDMVVHTLKKMHRGGIFDQVGYGFHRYSTDEHWLLPHFEKMLYDQALMVMAATAAWQVSGDDALRVTAEQVLTYVLRDMTSPEGGFYSAEDADSEGEEGLFYLWTYDELVEVLGEDEAELYARVYNVEREGNFREEASGRSTGRNIPHLSQPLSETAAELDMEPGELEERLEASRRKLFDVREERIHPLKDDKVLTDWNGLMIAACARAARAFDEPRYATAAKRAADFVLKELRDENGRLLKRYRLGQSGLPGTLSDYAFLTWGLLELYETSFEPRYVHRAGRERRRARCNPAARPTATTGHPAAGQESPDPAQHLRGNRWPPGASRGRSRAPARAPAAGSSRAALLHRPAGQIGGPGAASRGFPGRRHGGLGAPRAGFPDLDSNLRPRATAPAGRNRRRRPDLVVAGQPDPRILKGFRAAPDFRLRRTGHPDLPAFRLHLRRQLLEPRRPLNRLLDGLASGPVRSTLPGWRAPRAAQRRRHAGRQRQSRSPFPAHPRTATAGIRGRRAECTRHRHPRPG